ncbi:MAG: alpha/beta fold hydrolase [Alphaproteobacteria bacterium]|nr:alpha/beta fold hydrolase [Alphaproteobacteria bacterium]
MRATTTSDFWVEHPHGRIFTRIWRPEGRAGVEGAIVLFHDSLGCVDLWRNFPAALSASAGRPVIAYDRLGFGKSDARADKPGIDFIADEAKTYFPVIRQKIGFDRFIAFGHSVGGGMAVNCAAEFPAHCDALITESAQAFAEDKTLESISLARERFKAEGQIDRLEKYHGRKARWVLDAWIETWLHPDFADWSLASVLPLVRCELLAIHGAHDEFGSARHPEMISELSGGPSRFEIIPDTFHVPHREREELVVEMATKFVSMQNSSRGNHETDLVGHGDARLGVAGLGRLDDGRLASAGRQALHDEPPVAGREDRGNQ